MTNRILTLLVVALATRMGATGWPVAPRDSVHPLGNNWGEYQDYGGGSYYHPGIDVFPRQQGDPVYAVAHGWVKAWGTTSGEWHYRLAISDSAPSIRTRCSGWLYAHVDPNRAHKAVGDEVQEGEQIGYLVEWPVTGFDHCHFGRISDTGTTWSRFPSPTWWFTQNPLAIIEPNTDLLPPTFQNAVSGQRFGICRNNTNNYLDINNLVGDVDVVARVFDKTGFPTRDTMWDHLIPYKLEWSVRGSVAEQPATLGPIFAGYCPSNLITELTGIWYKEAAPCRSLGDYDYRDYYFIATNNDGDTTVELTDAAGCWRTADFPDDYYWVKVTAYDAFGNSTADSMRVHTANGNSIAEAGRMETPHHLDVPTVVRSGANLMLDVTLARTQRVRLELFDATGRLERCAFDRRLPAGSHGLSFSPASAGAHLLVLSLDGDRIVHKMTVLK